MMAHEKQARPDIYELSVQIVEFVDDAQPGWARSEFVDAHGQRHALVDKVPVFSREPLDGSSTYPKQGAVACAVLERWQDSDGKELARISVAIPYHVESTDGLSEFVVLSMQLHA